MFIRSFLSVLIVTSAFTLVFGQKPEAKTDKDKTTQAFAFSFEGNGGYLGIQMLDINKENFAKFGLREVRGVAIEKVMENSPASQAGLQSGDVIIRVDGDEITSARKLTRLINEIAPDHQVKMTILRNGSEQEITATLGKNPAPSFGNGNFEFQTPMPMDKFEMPDLKELKALKDLPKFKDMPNLKDLPKDGTPKVFSFPGDGKAFAWSVGGGRSIGVGATPLTKQLAEHFGVDGGVMVSEVRDGSPASKAGLKAGDIIVEADGKAVKNEIDLIRTINQKKEGDVTLTIVRDRNRQTVTVTPEVSKDAGFVFDTDGENGLTTPPVPGQFRVMTPATPMTNPHPFAPMTVFRPGRII